MSVLPFPSTVASTSDRSNPPSLTSVPPESSPGPSACTGDAESDLDHAPCQLGRALRARGFDALTAIQRAVLEPELEGADLRIHSQTGSGKTVALGFALAPEVAAAPRVRGKVAAPTSLLVAPTRELASQLGRELSWLYESLGASVAVVTGGASFALEHRQLAEGPAVVVGTPGRLLDHLRRGTLTLEGVSSLVLDEADELLDMGFEEELDAIFAFAPETRRTHLVSATFRRDVTGVADRLQQNPRMVQAAGSGKPNTDIAHVAHVVHPQAQADAVINILLRHPEDKTLVFVRTRADVQELSQALSAAGFPAAALSGELTHRKREETFAAFRSGVIRVLVATDVAARGLDVNDIARVIQADLPNNADVLTHRSGRTGRAGKGGENVVLVPPHAQRRFEALARGARVRPRFEPVPTAETILNAADERLRNELGAEEGEVGPRLRQLATRLLADGDPADVVARLLSRSAHAGPCAPRNVPAPSAKKARKAERTSKRRDRGETGERPRGDHRKSTAGSRSGAQPQGFVTYQVSWGAQTGADARRLLALVCRRSGLDKKDIGAIRIAPKSSTVEIAKPVAPQFEKAIKRKDPRDPHVRFRLWQPRK